MSFIYSQALVAEYLPAILSDTEPSVLSSGIPTPKLSLWHDKTMDHSRLSRFGMTCKPLTESLGAELLTLLRVASPAKTSAWPERALDLMANDPECGTTWPGSLAKYDPVSHSLKTAQLSLIEDLTGCLLTLPASGLMLSGQCWERPMLARFTSVSESGLWRTPTRDSATERTKRYAQGGLPLTLAVTMWPTPTTSDHTGAGAGPNKMGGPNLRTAVSKYPTPRASDHKGATNPAAAAAVARGHSPNLPEHIAELSAQRMYPTATATAYKGWSPNHNRADTDVRLDYTIERQGFQPGQQTPPMRLNPNWVEWLMGWPIGHTELKPLETDKFREWQRQHGEFLGPPNP